MELRFSSRRQPRRRRDSSRARRAAGEVTMARETGSATLTVPVTSRDHIQGPATAPVTLVEYGDFECPHCGHAHTIMKDVQRRLGPRLRFVFRHFPLVTIHPHAQHAAEAAEGAQEHFWEMHDT